MRAEEKEEWRKVGEGGREGGREEAIMDTLVYTSSSPLHLSKMESEEQKH